MAYKRKRFSLLEKAEIANKVKDYNGSKTDFANLIGIPYSSLETILKRADVLKQKSIKIGNLAKKRKTVTSSPFENLEKFLFEWFNEKRAANVSINGPVLRKKALEIALKLGIPDFAASNGWIDRFKKRYNLSYKT